MRHEQPAGFAQLASGRDEARRRSVKSHVTATQVTIGAVARMPKMIPNFRKSMMMSKPSRPPLDVRESVHEGEAELSRGCGSLVS